MTGKDDFRLSAIKSTTPGQSNKDHPTFPTKLQLVITYANKKGCYKR